MFKAHYHTILRLKSFFPFSLIDAMVGSQGGSCCRSPCAFAVVVLPVSRPAPRTPTFPLCSCTHRGSLIGTVLPSLPMQGTLDEARQQIMRELRYQSSLDLDEATYAAIR